MILLIFSFWVLDKAFETNTFLRILVMTFDFMESVVFCGVVENSPDSKNALDRAMKGSSAKEASSKESKKQSQTASTVLVIGMEESSSS